MANLTSAMSQIYAEGTGFKFATFRVIGASSADNVVLTTAFNVVMQAAAMPPGLTTGASTLAISGTTVTFAALTLSAVVDDIYLIVIGSGS